MTLLIKCAIAHMLHEDVLLIRREGLGNGLGREMCIDDVKNFARGQSNDLNLQRAQKARLPVCLVISISTCVARLRQFSCPGPDTD